MTTEEKLRHLKKYMERYIDQLPIQITFIKKVFDIFNKHKIILPPMDSYPSFEEYIAHAEKWKT